tara:strand:+ start:14311 stop:16383 length:2073 start_codon:yes stop_codon:yes gene_type:complete
MRLKLPVKKTGTIDRQGQSKLEGDKETLVMIVPGILNSWKHLDPVIEASLDACPDADVWAPIAPWRKPFTQVAPDKILSNLTHDLDQIWERGTYTRLHIIGHSMGGIYVRALLTYIRRRMEHWDEAEKQRWTATGRRYWGETSGEDRLVLLAAVNRGFAVNRHMGPMRVVKMMTGMLIAKTIEFFLPWVKFTLSSGERGAKFLTQMRLDWLEEEQRSAKGEAPPLPHTVQLLGSVDDIVGPEDNIDFETGQAFRYLDVAKTGHLNILHMGLTKRKRGISPEEQHRREKLKQALTYSDEELKREEVRPWELREISSKELERRRNVEHVVFVIHGIRDEGHWTDKIARRVWKRAKDSEKETMEKVVESYGYFGMGPFLIPAIRWSKVGWLMERYLETKAKYPNAKFSYIGHSHGTYVLAKALETYSNCRFHNIVFAGSIVRENYNWMERIEAKQASNVLNLTATSDLVVAWFPRFFDLYNLQDLGGASHNGFDQATEDGPVFNLEYATGSHGAGKVEKFWDTIADFVLLNDKSEFANLPVPTERVKPNRTHPWPAFVWLLSWGNVLVWAVLVVGLLGVVPMLILQHWPKAVELPSWWTPRKSLLVPLLGALALVGYLRIAISQRAYRRKGGILRNFVAFPLVIGVVGWGLSFLVAKVPAISFDLCTLPTLYEWRTTAAVLWVGFVFWLLRRI